MFILIYGEQKIALVENCFTSLYFRPHEDLTIVKRRKLHWYGHVSRSPGLAKTILQGTVKGGRRQGRQGKRWENNIREWTGLEFANPTRQRRTEKNEGN